MLQCFLSFVGDFNAIFLHNYCINFQLAPSKIGRFCQLPIITDDKLSTNFDEISWTQWAWSRAEVDFSDDLSSFVDSGFSAVRR